MSKGQNSRREKGEMSLDGDENLLTDKHTELRRNPSVYQRHGSFTLGEARIAHTTPHQNVQWTIRLTHPKSTKRVHPSMNSKRITLSHRHTNTNKTNEPNKNLSTHTLIPSFPA